MAEETKTPSYKQGAYPEIDPNSEEFEDICNMWCGEFSPSITEKMEMEGNFFTGSDWFGNVNGFNPNPGRVYPPAAREMLRRPTSNTPSNKNKESLGVVAVLACLLLLIRQLRMRSVYMDMQKFLL